MKEGKYKTGDTVYIVSSGKVMEAGAKEVTPLAAR